MKSKICNQYPRTIDGKNVVKCACCGETSDMPKLPVGVTVFIDFLNNFTKLHTSKGCNKTRIVAESPFLVPVIKE